MNLRIGKKLYYVDLENRTVKNHNGGYLRKQEKIDEILKDAEQARKRRLTITKEFKIK